MSLKTYWLSLHYLVIDFLFSTDQFLLKKVKKMKNKSKEKCKRVHKVIKNVRNRLYCCIYLFVGIFTTVFCIVDMILTINQETNKLFLSLTSALESDGTSVNKNNRWIVLPKQLGTSITFHGKEIYRKSILGKSSLKFSPFGKEKAFSSRSLCLRSEAFGENKGS